MQRVVAEDYTLVTHNARDFRGAGPDQPGGYHARETIHAGLVCLTSVLSPMDMDRQRDLFAIALEHLAGQGDLVNQALEVFEHDDSAVSLIVYAIP